MVRIDGKNIGNLLNIGVTAWHLWFFNVFYPPVPFCSSLDISLPSKLVEDENFLQQPATSVPLSIVNHRKTSSRDNIKITHDSVVSWPRQGSSEEQMNPSLSVLLSETDSASGMRLYS